jgi:hypothetical protein
VPSGRHGPDHAKERLWQAYDDTAIKDQLAAEGRLKGDVCNPDYDFLDPRLDDFFRELNDVLHVSGWIHGHRALSPAINWAWNEVAILEGLFRPLDRMEGYKADLRHLTAASNAMVLGVVEEMATYHAGGVRPTFSGHQIAGTRRRMLPTSSPCATVSFSAIRPRWSKRPWPTGSSPPRTVAPSRLSS